MKKKIPLKHKLVVKAGIWYMRRWAKNMDIGLRISDTLNDIFGEKDGERAQDELINIFRKIEKQFKSDRKESD